MNTTLITSASSKNGQAALYLVLVIALFLIALARTTHAQQTAGAPRSQSQYDCQQIAVLGAVRTPTRLKAPQRLRLLEVLAKVGGPNERAGKTVRIVHTCSCSPCDKPETKPGDVDEFNLVDVLSGGVENRNPYVLPGEVVMVPEASSIYVVGNVRTVYEVRFVEGMTATRAVALTGGIVKRSELVVIRIHRRSTGAAQANPIIVNLRKAMRDSTEDILLQPFDIVEVSDEWGHFRPLKLGNPIWDPPVVPRKDTSA